MKKLLTLVLTLALIAVSAFAFAESTKLVIGATSTPHGEILEFAKPLLAEKGIELDIQIFEDYVMPNEQLEAKDLDANFFQHIPYLENFNAEKGTHLAVLGGVHLEPMGIYLNTVASLDEVADGAVVFIPNDTTNEYRALKVLATYGLISLPETDSLELTALDITADLNPKGLKFQEIAAESIPNLFDDCDLAVINSNYALQAGEDRVGKPAVLEATEDNPYVNVVAVREDDDREALKTLIEVLQGDEVAAFITETYGDAVIPAK